MRSLVAVVRAAYAKGNEDGLFDMGATLAYYALFSLFPLLLITLSVVGFFVGPTSDLRAQILDAIPQQASELVGQALDNLNNNAAGASIVGFVTLLFSASGFFGALSRMFDRIWNVVPAETEGLVQSALTVVRGKLLAFLLVLGVAAVAVASVTLSSLLSGLSESTSFLPGSEWGWRLVQLLVPLALLTLVYGALFKLLPNTHVGWGDVWLGAGLSALLFTVLQQVIGLYLGTSDLASYGAIGAVMALLLWLYFTNVILVFGGEVARAYAYAHGSRADETPPPPVAPDAPAVRQQAARKPRKAQHHAINWRDTASTLAIWGILSLLLGGFARRNK
jgi:membrane protein